MADAPRASVMARVAREEGCPLYSTGAMLCFRGVEVSGEGGAPVCAILVSNLLRKAQKIAAGAEPEAYMGSSCGGCEAGKAFLDFSVLPHDVGNTAQYARVVQLLEKLPLFGSAKRSDIEKVLPLLKERRFDADQTIIRKGDVGRDFYLIVEGSVEVIQYDQYSVENLLNQLGPGDCFGEMSLITGEVTSATIRARTAAVCMVVEKENFHRLLTLIPSINLALAKILAQRLAKAGNWVVQKLGEGILGKLEMIRPGELVQAMNVNGQTGTLHVRDDKADRTAVLYFQDGHLRDAVVGSLRGDDAFYDFLRWTSGNFRFEPGAAPPDEQSVSGDTISLLLEGLRRMDEKPA